VKTPQTADVVIVGAGIVGASIAYHLTSAGCRDVVLLEKESHQGKGSTGKSMGGVRAQFSTPVNIQMSHFSIPFFRDFEQALGHPSGYRGQGYLFVATAGRHLEYLRANRELQLSLGLNNVEALTREGVLRLCPQLRSDDILGGNFCPTDGFVDPHSVMTGFTKKAVEQGARVIREAEVTGIQIDARGVAGVVTTDSAIATRIVVNAAGAWAAGIARMAGIELPVEPLRRMLVPTEPFDKVSHESPMVVDMGTGFHFRPEGRGLLMAWNDHSETAGFKTTFDPAFVEKILSYGVDRLPVLEEAEVNPKRAWAGLYEMTPDHHGILGAVPEVPGFFLANGFSGHGVMHSPATGRILADLILHGSTELIDARTLSFERFREGRLIEETALL
jgi:sarcosine oxidase subunit beta